MSFHRALALLLFTVYLFACGGGADAPPGFADKTTPDLQVNQVGYYSKQPIRFTYAAVAGDDSRTPPPDDGTYYLMNAATDSAVTEGRLGAPENWQELAGVTARSATIAPPAAGRYRVYVPGVGYSPAFTVGDSVLHGAFLASMRGLYYQRASQELRPEHAGDYARALGHPDTDIRYHPSSGRTTGSLRSPGGWYDAGDYNKYVVNGAFPVGQLLALYEDVGDPAPDGTLNIPESGNGKSDYLDEVKYELDWLLTMQDDDGGLFHKLTALNFEGMVMPAEATAQRYVVAKSTAATFDFAGATAQAARVYRDYDPAYASRLLAAARHAWQWGLAHPAEFFKNPEDVTTGEYGDGNADDERAWAAAELFATTGEQEYYREMRAHPPRIRAGAGWNGYMANLAAFSLLRHPDRVPREYYDTLSGLVETLADSLVMDTETTAYYQPLRQFRWGSNSDVLNDAMIIAAAHRRDPKPEYLTAMQGCMNYILGHNPNGVSYLTGFGERSPQFIHHRPSAADGIDAPVPGLLSGGPNPGQQDREEVTYPAGLSPMTSWIDQTPSYATNEICLNWNAPFTYVAGYLEAVR